MLPGQLALFELEGEQQADDPRNKHRGAECEYIGTVWLIRQDYEVFRNVSAVGIVDLIARHRKTGEILLIDVKSCSPNDDGGHRGILSKEQWDAGVRVLAVDQHDRCGFVNSRGPSKCHPQDIKQKIKLSLVE